MALRHAVVALAASLVMVAGVVQAHGGGDGAQSGQRGPGMMGGMGPGMMGGMGPGMMGGMGPGMMGGMGPGMVGGMGPGTTSGMGPGMMGGYGGVDAAVRAEVVTLYRDHAGEQGALIGELWQKRVDLAAALGDPGADPTAVGEAFAAVADVERRLLENRIALRSRLREVLGERAGSRSDGHHRQ